jgi:hypothetical protein
MSAGTYNFTMTQGCQYNLDLTVTSDGTTPVNITGYSVRFQMRSSAAGLPLVSYSTANGSITITGSTGQIFITIQESDTSPLLINGLAKEFLYAVTTTTPGGVDDEIVTGTITMNRALVR